jgi:FeS assembly SUF system protein
MSDSLPPAETIPDAATTAEPAEPIDRDEIEKNIIDAIKTVYDPEIPVNIFEMGLIYGVDIQPDGAVKVTMTLTAPTCPSAQELPVSVRQSIKGIPGVSSVGVEIVWDPPWTPAKMSEAAKLQLGMF